MATNNDVNTLGLDSNVIDGSTSQTNEQIYFVGTGKNYIKKVDSGNFINVNQSGNFYRNTNPVGSNFSDVLDGGSSSRDTSQFIAPIVGGVFPNTKNGI